jgi:predicted nucleic acid-binding protein
LQVGYVETSVLVAIAFDEPVVSSIVERVRSLDRIYSSTLLESEFLAALSREGVPGQAAALLDAIRWVFPNRRLTSELLLILEKGYLRGADLHHLATALYLFPDPSQAFFVTLDNEQSHVAQGLGFLNISARP